ncbi:hypothetical protein [Devosia sp. Root685]|uniref:hypothetical protein n=1 Tax=Devosia sp. Root685 TaxID=1736587 RepID=UPI000A5F968F|nr:hypothetical protein [Devosia sp. Root685]
MNDHVLMDFRVVDREQDRFHVELLCMRRKKQAKYGCFAPPSQRRVRAILLRG